MALVPRDILDPARALPGAIEGTDVLPIARPGQAVGSRAFGVAVSKVVAAVAGGHAVVPVFRRSPVRPARPAGEAAQWDGMVFNPAAGWAKAEPAGDDPLWISFAALPGGGAGGAPAYTEGFLPAGLARMPRTMPRRGGWRRSRRARLRMR